jgi:hypothetical protein
MIGTYDYQQSNTGVSEHDVHMQHPKTSTYLLYSRGRKFESRSSTHMKSYLAS